MFIQDKVPYILSQRIYLVIFRKLNHLFKGTFTHYHCPVEVLCYTQLQSNPLSQKYPFLLTFKEKDLVKVNFSFWVSGSYGRCLRNVHFWSFVFIINLIFYKTILISSFKNTINLAVWLTHLTMAVHIVYNNTAVVDKACQLFPCQQDKRDFFLLSDHMLIFCCGQHFLSIVS